ncbi:lytic transglycosylase domain-containing protein [Saccharopolyspora elongata]|uniref:Lytic transglycosylase n=1 Tax=Saccharopolyspora elongata TaxID=2530387 RepID=A0A4R4YVQ2_9PSEU|nr:lytic murein transglycosylase [Saccharopolyspora elongata]TDD47742.1 lytic transglycosylase [Saccharopolyspora elongata]
MELVTARNKRHGKHEWKSVPRLGAAARRRARRWVALTALAPVLLVPTTLMAASSSFLAEPRHPVLGDPDSRELGVSGNLPQAPLLSPEVLERAADPQRLAAEAEQLVELPTGPLGIPESMLAAYVKAARQVERGCGLHWSVLASIGRIESGHARSGSVDVLGTTVRAVLGPRLSGGPGIAAIPDTDAGRYDGDPVWDRAVGPMQFIPSTWNKFAVDGNDDGVTSPHNIHDASLAAARYLCSGGGDLREPQSLAAAVFRYNHSDSYVRTVLIWAVAYAKGVTPTPSELAPEVGDVLDGERLPDGPQVLAMAPPAPAPAQAPAPASAPPAAPAPTGPPPPAPESRPAESQISITPPEIARPSAPDLNPPVATPPNSTQPGHLPMPHPAPPGATQPGPPPSTTQPGPPPTAPQPGPPPSGTQPSPPPTAPQPGPPPSGTQPSPPPTAPQPGPPPSGTQPGPPPGATQPGPPPSGTQPGPPPDGTQPGPPPGATQPGPPSTQPGPPPTVPQPGPPPSGTQPGSPPDSSQPGPPPPAEQPAAPPPEPTSPPSSTPDEAPKACDPTVLANGGFATSPGAVPGASDPHSAVPGQTVYVDQGTAGQLEPCVVPDGFAAPPR